MELATKWMDKTKDVQIAGMKKVSTPVEQRIAVVNTVQSGYSEPALLGGGWSPMPPPSAPAAPLNPFIASQPPAGQNLQQLNQQQQNQQQPNQQQAFGVAHLTPQHQFQMWQYM